MCQENYRTQAQQILDEIAKEMQRTMDMREDPAREYQEFWWDHWWEAVSVLGYGGTIDDEFIIAYDELYIWKESQGYPEVTLEVGDFVRYLTDEELA